MARERLIAAAAAILVAASGVAVAKEKYGKLIRTIERDDSYKVRMQAIRVLSKRLGKSGAKPSDRVIGVLSQAAKADEEHLVRGMACFALGKLEDPRGVEALEYALRDRDAFVRAQAEEALKKVRAKGGPAPAAGPAVLVIGTDVVPGVSVPAEISTAMEAMLTQGFQSRSGGRFTVGEKKGVGYHMKGSIAELSVKPDGEASRVTIVVKIAIATWPDNNLRHVMSAKASARAKVSSGSSLIRLQRKLLEAAVNKAIQDSMAQIGGG